MLDRRQYIMEVHVLQPFLLALGWGLVASCTVDASIGLPGDGGTHFDDGLAGDGVGPFDDGPAGDGVGPSDDGPAGDSDGCPDCAPPLSSAKEITRFTILGIDGAIGASSIVLVVPYGTSLTSLTPTIIYTGASISPASGLAQDFTTSVTYTVTAADGSTRAYTATVTADPFSGTRHYVDPAGHDDGGDAPLEDPWASLSYACEQVATVGDVIHINAGNYVESSPCLLKIGVSIEGDGDDSTFIVSSVTGQSTIQLYSSAVTTGSQSISGIFLDGDDLTAHSPVTVSRRSNVRIHDCTFVDFYDTGVSFYGESGTPSNFCVDNEFFNNTLTNCASYWVGGSPGNLQIDAQEGMRVYGNTITQTARGAGADGFAIKCVEGYNKDLKIYENTIIVDSDDGTYWTFAMEFWNSMGGIEIFNNRVQGVIDLAGHFGEKGDYDYSFSVHDNVIGHDVLKTTDRHGIYIENTSTLSDIIIYNNIFKNLSGPVKLYTLTTSRFSNITFAYNVFYNIGKDSDGWWGYGFSEGGETGYTLDNLSFLNNVFVPAERTGTQSLAAIEIPSDGTTTNVFIRNNIIAGFDYAAICTSQVGVGSVAGVWIEKNILHDNANSNAPLWWAVQPSSVTLADNPSDDPKFVTTPLDFHLQSDSPARDAGMNVGLSFDLEGHGIVGLPDIGAYEYH